MGHAKGRTADTMYHTRAATADAATADYTRETYDFPADFEERLKRFQEEEACRGRRSPDASAPTAIPHGVGGQAGAVPIRST